MLEVRALEASYGATPVLHAVDLHVAAGEAVVLLGGPGAGKTTLNRALSGLVPPRGGRVRFLERDITGADHVDVVRAGLIHVPQGGRVFPNLVVRDNLLLGATVRNRVQRGIMMDYVLGLLPRLAARLQLLAGRLAAGDQRLLAIGRGLMAAPRLLVLDEPAGDLAPGMAEDVFELVCRLSAQGLAMLVAEQDLRFARTVANRCYVMAGGRIIADGPATALADAGQHAATVGNE
jgi:branched-chain amino acid transport system ATP-binding protein